ncbi:CPBP family intramembrane glutamic endopeptidase [Rubellicoccus peritrichatus]|uniref:CPBP family intramembrane glutamic endopeptidase n=1 Tax=Rubellicoccus peritrichatus TaxID=3080537 RepID=A0AAQ3LFC8_9BACT|nr:CPBP family intramembrane glutamic endopeptidase [Puniceicoccus sp. CR14]WOO40969.1 CPBP family intramembrane glutamic endopeptidase [Puniceicoccus sp. CR14]
MNTNRWTWQTSGLLVLIVIELLYIAATRYLLVIFNNVNDIELEAIRTVLRLTSALVTWLLFKDVALDAIRKGKLSLKGLAWQSSLPLLAIILFLSIPVIIGNWNLNQDGTRLFFALSSFPVGLREELVYRGVLLTILTKRFGFITGLIISTIAFTFYHYGALPWTVFNIVQYVTAGVLLSALFWATKSLWLVIWIHTIYDAIWCYTPFLSPPMHISTGFLILYITTGLATVWIFLGYIKNRQFGKI